MDFVRALTNARNSVLKHISRRQRESSSRLSMQNTVLIIVCLHERHNSGIGGWICWTASGSSTLLCSTKQIRSLRPWAAAWKTNPPKQLPKMASNGSPCINFGISSTTEPLYQEPRADRSFKLFVLIRPFVDGSCRTLFNEMGVRWWAVEPRHLEFGEKADKDRRSAKSIRLATSFFQAFTRQEALKCP